jgi:hypothetical protein
MAIPGELDGQSLPDAMDGIADAFYRRGVWIA